MPVRGLWPQWYFNVPDVIIVALMYLLVAYGILSLVLREGNIVMRVLRVLTSPARVPVAVLTPRGMPRAFVAIFTIVLLYIVRIVLFTASQAVR